MSLQDITLLTLFDWEQPLIIWLYIYIIDYNVSVTLTGLETFKYHPFRGNFFCDKNFFR